MRVIFQYHTSDLSYPKVFLCIPIPDAFHMFQALSWRINQAACFPTAMLLTKTALWPIAIIARATVSIGRATFKRRSWNSRRITCTVDSSFLDKKNV